MGLNESFATLRERIKPAVLDSNHLPNGKILRAFLDAKGFDIANASDDALTTALYEAVTVEAAKLKWLIKPAKLKMLDEKPRTLVNAHQEQNEFLERVKKAEATKVTTVNQASVKKQLDQFIENILFVDGLRGQVDHSKTGKIKDACQKHLEKAIAGKRDLTQVAKEIRDFVGGEYEKEERARERM